MSGAADEAARFAALYAETSDDVLAFLLRRCPTPEDAADCLAETYLVAWEKRGRRPSGAQARPWLFGVARNVMRRGHDRDRRLAATTEALGEELRAAVAARPPLDASDAVAAALSALSPLDQEIITMLSWDDLTPREVGTILGVSPNVVRVRAHRARGKLRSALARGDATAAPDLSDTRDAPGGDRASPTRVASRAG